MTSLPILIIISLVLGICILAFRSYRLYSQIKNIKKKSLKNQSLSKEQGVGKKKPLPFLVSYSREPNAFESRKNEIAQAIISDDQKLFQEILQRSSILESTTLIRKLNSSKIEESKDKQSLLFFPEESLDAELVKS